MKQLKKSAIVSMVVASVFFHSGTSHAIPIPTIGAEIVNQVKMVKNHLDELKKFKDQITNNIAQAKSMGDKLSLDGLKGMLKGGMSKDGINGLLGKGLTIPSGMKKTGYNDDVAKDPEKTKDWVNKNMKQPEGQYDPEKQIECEQMKHQLMEELSTTNVAEGLAFQNQAAAGKEIAEANDAASNVTDQMQAYTTQNLILIKTLQTTSMGTKFLAKNSTGTGLSNMCQ